MLVCCPFFVVMDIEVELENQDCTELNDINDILQVWNIQENNSLRMIHLNIRSIKKHFLEFSSYVRNVLEKIDLIVLTEININESDYKSVEGHFQLDGMSSLSFNRKSGKGGGILIFIKNKYKIKKETSLTIHFESCMCQINVSPKLNLTLLAMYRPPNSNTELFMQELQRIVEVNQREFFIIVGDMNINISESNRISEKYLSILYNNGFISKINCPTREEYRTNDLVSNCIDHLFVRSKNYDSKGAVIRSKISDHYFTSVEILLPCELISNTNPIKTKTYINKTVLKNQLKERLQLNNTEAISNSNNLMNYLVESFSAARTLATRTFQPRKKLTMQKNWMNKEILKLMTERDKTFRMIRRSNCPETKTLIRNKYNKLRNQVTREINAAKERYYSRSLENAKTDIKITWNLINEILGRKRKAYDDIQLMMNFQGDAKSIADQFTQFFGKIYNETSHTCDKKLYKVLPITSIQTMFLPDITEEELKRIIQTLKRKGPGIDNIAISDIVDNLDVLLGPIHKICQMSLREGRVPEKLKHAIVKPVFKKGEKSEMTNYRPISILPAIDKIIEKYIAEKLITFLNKYKLIDDNQYGFRKDKNTQTLLETFSNYVNTCLDKNLHVLVIFVDFSKAFDSINHKVLIELLGKIGIRGTLLDWMRDYLNNRKMSSKVQGMYSDEIIVGKGVPQGSILGPLLYLLYVNDVRCSFKSCSYYLYADDTVIISSHQNLTDANEMIQKDFNNFQKWAHDKELVINKEKTTVMHIRSPHLRYHHIPQVLFHSNDCLHNNSDILNCDCANVLPMVKNQKYLGLVIDEHFTWSNHISILCEKLRLVNNRFYWLKRILSKECLKSVYHSLFESHIAYGITVYGFASDYILKPLIRLQDSVVKKICAGIVDEDFDVYYRSLDLLSFSKLLTYKSIINNYSRLQNCEVIGHSYGTRQMLQGNLISAPFTNKYGKRTFNFAIPKIFNSLPLELRIIKKLSRLKVALKEWLILHPSVFAIV